MRNVTDRKKAKQEVMHMAYHDQPLKPLYAGITRREDS